MSPPCQPFTTTDASKQLGGLDKRNKAFMHIMKLLREISQKPKLIVFENVKGFENSQVHKEWLTLLKEQGYKWRQYRASPLDVGIPMNRTRFYMVCKLSPEEGSQQSGTCHGYSTQDITSTLIPTCKCEAPPPYEGFTFKSGTSATDGIGKDVSLEGDVSGSADVLPLKHFMLSQAAIKAEEFEQLVLSKDVLSKPWAKGLSIVGEDDRVTFCFTSSYGQRMHKSSGSTFHMTCPRGKRVSRDGDFAEELAGKLRLFSPSELLRLFGFPSTFSFPEDMKLRQQWRLIGQSVSVTVVQHLIHAALCENLI